MHTHKHKKGFSLVEMIVYVSLLALFLVLVVELIVVMSTSYRKLTLARTIAQAGVVSMERITREIRTATDVDLLQSTLDASPGRIRLYTTNESGFTQIISFALEDGRVNVYENDLFAGSLTSSKASTTALLFGLYDNGRSKAVSIDMTLEASKGEELRTESFRTTVELRNSF